MLMVMKKEGNLEDRLQLINKLIVALAPLRWLLKIPEMIT